MGTTLNSKGNPVLKAFFKLYTDTHSHKFHDRMKQNAQDVVALIAPGLANAHEEANLPPKLRQDSMKCFQVSNS